MEENGIVYWQCFSLDYDHTVTTIYDDCRGEKALNLITKRINSIPKIIAEEVHFDMNFRKMYKESYFDYACALKIYNGTIIVVNFSTVLGGRMKLSYSTLLSGTIKYFYDRYVVLQCESGCIFYEVYGGRVNKKYCDIVSIDKVLKKGLENYEIPKKGLAILDEISFRKIKTSDSKENILEINYWYNKNKTSIYDFNGVIFEI